MLWQRAPESTGALCFLHDKIKMAPEAGLEPATNGLTVRCSADWATPEPTVIIIALTRNLSIETDKPTLEVQKAYWLKHAVSSQNEVRNANESSVNQVKVAVEEVQREQQEYNEKPIPIKCHYSCSGFKRKETEKNLASIQWWQRN